MNMVWLFNLKTKVHGDFGQWGLTVFQEIMNKWTLNLRVES